MMLHTERATRGQQRAFVRYGDLLDDWTQPVFALGEAFDLAGVKTAMAVDIAEVHRFIDPSLRRVTMTWDDIGVPDRLRELADETWQALDADRHRRHRRRPRSGATSCAPPTPSSTPTRRRSPTRRSSPSGVRLPPTRAARRPSRLRRAARADRVPHAVRAMVPPAARQKLRKAMGRERPA